MTVRRVLITLGLLALIGVVAANVGSLKQFPQQLGSVNPLILALIVPIQLGGYLSMAKFYQSFLALFDYKLETRKLFETSVAINFVNQAFPSGGISGLSYLAKSLGDEVPMGKTTLTQLGRYAFTYLSFLMVLVAGFLLLFAGGNVNRVTVRLILLFIMALITAAAVIIALIHQRSLVEKIIWPLTRFANRVWRFFTRRRKTLITDEKLRHFITEFYHGYEVLREKWGQWHSPILYAMGSNLGELATYYTVFLAFGKVINPGVVIAAYTLANIISLAAVVTNGAGLLEATMIGALVALGQPFSLSFSVVLLSRVINMAVFLPLGFYYYRKGLTS